MPLRRGLLRSPSFATLDDQTYAVAYKHHLDRIDTNPGEITTFYAYRARTISPDDEGRPWEWGMDFKMAVERTRQIIVAEPEWDGGKLMSVGHLNCHGERLLIEIRPSPVETIKLAKHASGDGSWTPDGYDDANHIFNHADLRR
jgi:hypothetical protein